MMHLMEKEKVLRHEMMHPSRTEGFISAICVPVENNNNFDRLMHATESEDSTVVDGLIACDWVWDLMAPMHLGLLYRPFVPHVQSWEP